MKTYLAWITGYSFTVGFCLSSLTILDPLHFIIYMISNFVFWPFVLGLQLSGHLSIFVNLLMK
jgi:hypothetical protein